MGPGPSDVSPRVLRAMSRPLVGHLDPEFLKIMNEIQDLLRSVFQTGNSFTLPLSGTGSSGMEASVANFVEEGDSVLVGANGVFGQRIAEMVRRNGGVCTVVSAPWGEPLSEKSMLEAAEKCQPGIIAVVHAETSTGVLQPLEPIREICDRFEALFLVDAVTSLGGHPVDVDSRKIDICYSGTQKCLSCPPGLAPVTFSPRAEEKLKNRTTPCKSWYLDLNLIGSYWGEDRVYHHTAPISMNYALREALKIIVEEGLEQRFNRHRRNHQALVAGVEALGMKMHVDPTYRLWSLNTVRIPDGVDDAQVRSQLLSQFNLEIGGGLGELQGEGLAGGVDGGEQPGSKCTLFSFSLGDLFAHSGISMFPGSGSSSCSCALYLIRVLSCPGNSK